MLLFRSEEHVDRWVEQGKGPRGALLTMPQVWGLADRWYGNRMAPDWRRLTPAEALAVFAELGLAGDFWQLPSPA